MWINLKDKMREASAYRTEYSKTLDSALEDSLELCKEPKKDWNGKVKKVCVILTSSRGGSSLMKEVLSKSNQFVSLPGEEEPYYIMTKNLFPFGSESDEVHHLKNKAAILKLMYNDLGVPVSNMSLSKISRDWQRRLIYQFPEGRFPHVDTLVRNCYGTSNSYEEGTKLFLRALHGYKSGYYDIVNKNSDYIEEFKIEEPPYVVPGNKRPLTTSDLEDKILLFKTPQDYCRHGIFEDLFPNADIKYIHLTRGFAQSVNGLMDGWLSDTGFFAYNMDVINDMELNITGYSDVKRFGKKWWKFDLFPNWHLYSQAPLVDVCTQQWLSAHSNILYHGPKNTLRIKFENYLTDKQGTTDSVCNYLGIESFHVDDLPQVMITEKPKMFRWHKRKDEIMEVWNAIGIRPNTGLGSQIRNTMRALGYSTDPETWI